MRVVFSCNALVGHVHPALPLARAARRQGHEVAFLSGPDVRGVVEGEGFELLCCGPDFASLVGEAFTRFPDAPLVTPQDQQRFGFGRLFSAVRVGLTVDDASAVIDAFRPDLVVNEVADFVGPLMAARFGCPNATLGVGLVLTDEWLQLAAAAVATYWETAGLEPRDDAGLYRSLYLNQWPRSLQRPVPEQRCAVHDLRPEVYGADTKLPRELDRLGDERPIIYVTFGTMFGDVPTLRTVIEGLADLDVDLVVTVGYNIDPATIDVGKSNTVVRQFIPQGALLGRCRLVISHGGVGSILGPLHYGVPLIVVPLGADQLENADRLAAANVAHVIQLADLTSRAVGEAAAATLNDEMMLANALALRDEIALMPTPNGLVPTLESLTRPHS
jgi:UDP:flavonoid glycosyltransferase YjiC (YdhE family)